MASIECYNWEEIDFLCRRLADRVRASGERFDVLVAILRGGAVPGVILANELGIDEMLGIKIVQEGQMTGVAEAIEQERAGEAVRAYSAAAGRVLVPLNDVALAGRRVLVVDDVLDSGESARLALGHVAAHGAAVVKLATLQVKTYSSFEPDFFVEVKTHWLFYPWMSQAELKAMRQRQEVTS